MKTLIYAAMLCASLCPAAAQNDSTLSLQQCIDMAVANNAAMKTAANNTEAARQQRREAFTKYFPEISAQGFGFRTHNYVLQYNALDLLKIELVKHGAMAGVQALQPIFMGGQIVNGNQLAKVGEAVAELQASQTASEVKVTAEKYYWQLATLKATKSALTTGLELLDTLSRQVEVAVDAGIVTTNELLKVRLQRNEFASKMVDLDNGIKLSRM
ncbi:MAG: TolC family protein, partial [Muribaculaceae bacterium]|nr:TolC family protein [Muribaculaceae bacterium]